ncbi:transporter [Aquimarina sp. AD1]|uniref:transporter n=1 Tax=Aquimarina sp. (strain AD1) TaxID=1714848 RepID=UPI000E4E9A94|nr:transporter [Aquimarina sp. AD1]AXT54721.1 transporter [Aquimarina sp. AD1]RKN19637.1 transporter [Aquimarina sp. AD1]
MKKYIYVIIIMTAQFISGQEESKENKWSGSRPDGHAPISVMGDHTHGKGEFMFSYRYMYMNMEDLNRGSENVGFSNALRPNDVYMVTPTSMPMNMHMLGMMYAPSDKITLIAMVNYLSQEMDHLTAMNGVFTTESSGFGDTKIAALYKFFNKNKQQLHGQIGISIPTGSIDEKDVTPASTPNEVILPYPMQIGSGTWDTEITLTYLKQWNILSFGTQARTTLRVDENDNEYRLGNKYSLNNWVAITATNWLSFSGRFEFGAIDKINGTNPDLNPMMVITADTANSGMTYANAGLGFNLYAFKGSLKNLRLGFEAAIPLFQNMNGVQLRNKETITLGFQYAL